jgi:hypothetical protein
MGRWIGLAAMLALLGGCGTFTGKVATDPARDVLGVSADQPRAGADEAAPQPVLDMTARALDYKESQICTRGFDPVRQDVEPGSNDRVFADWQFRCKNYHFSLPGIDLAFIPF